MCDSHTPIAGAARWDGVVLAGEFGLEVAPDDVRRAVDYIAEFRGSTAAAAGEPVNHEYAAPAGSSLDEVRTRLRAGPPQHE
jgi:hypothetical protein